MSYTWSFDHLLSDGLYDYLKDNLQLYYKSILDHFWVS